MVHSISHKSPLPIIGHRFARPVDCGGMQWGGVRAPWSMVRAPWSVVRALWSVVLDPGSVVRALWSVVRGPGSVVRGLWSGVRGPWSRLRGPGSVVRAPWSGLHGPGSVVRALGSVVRALWPGTAYSPSVRIMAGRVSSSSSSRTAGVAAIALVVEGGGDVPSLLRGVLTPPGRAPPDRGEGDWEGGVTEGVAGMGGGGVDVASGMPPGGAAGDEGTEGVAGVGGGGVEVASGMPPDGIVLANAMTPPNEVMMKGKTVNESVNNIVTECNKNNKIINTVIIHNPVSINSSS